MIEIYLLEQLDAFARCGTLSGASKELHISQPALTRSMKKLEADIGIALFQRDKRKLTLNAAGKIVAEYAGRIIDDEHEMILRAVEADRREHTLTLGSCGVLAINHLMPIMTQTFRDKSIITEISSDELLISRLKNRSCHIAVLHEKSNDMNIFCQHYFDEQLYISLPLTHPLAKKKTLKTADLKGLSILTFDVGFWVELCKEKLPDTSFLFQTDADTMDELVHASDLPVFNSDRMLEDGYVPENSVSVKLSETFAHTSYYVACLDSEKERYSKFFNIIRSEAIQKNIC